MTRPMLDERTIPTAVDVETVTLDGVEVRLECVDGETNAWEYRDGAIPNCPKCGEPLATLGETTRAEAPVQPVYVGKYEVLCWSCDATFPVVQTWTPVARVWVHTLTVTVTTATADRVAVEAATRARLDDLGRAAAVKASAIALHELPLDPDDARVDDHDEPLDDWHDRQDAHVRGGRS